METKTQARILTSYYRLKPGGLCKRLIRAINAILDEGYVVHYLAVEKLPINNLNCIYHKFPWPKDYCENFLFWSVFHLLAPIQLFIIALSCRVTHMFAFGVTYAFVMQPVRKFLKLPLTLFLRGDPLAAHLMSERGNIIIAIDKFIEKNALKKVYLYSTSEALLNKIVRRNQEIDIASKNILRNNIDSLKFHKRNEKNSLLRLSCVGTIDAGKNQIMLLTIMSKLTSKNCILNIYGTGRDEELIRDKILHLKLNERVIMHGWCETEKIWKNTDLLLMPSVHEGSPNAILESLGSGIPVLASNIPEHREILPDEAVFDLSDECSWLDKIEEIAQDLDFEISRLFKIEMMVANKLIFDWDKRIVSKILNT